MRPFIVAACLLTACGDSTGPGDRVPRLGVYEYQSQIENGVGWSRRMYTGTMTITAATPDAIAVTWQVEGFKTEPEDGIWNESAYRVEGDPESFGTIAHRVTRSGSGLSCTGVIYGVGPGGLVSQPVTCTMTYRHPPDA